MEQHVRMKRKTQGVVQVKCSARGRPHVLPKALQRPYISSDGRGGALSSKLPALPVALAVARGGVRSVVSLKGVAVDIEDLDGVVGPGAGQLEPAALLATCLPPGPAGGPGALLPGPARPGPPAQPLHRQRVALSGATRKSKRNRFNGHWHFSTVAVYCF